MSILCVSHTLTVLHVSPLYVFYSSEYNYYKLGCVALPPPPPPHLIRLTACQCSCSATKERQHSYNILYRLRRKYNDIILYTIPITRLHVLTSRKVNLINILYFINVASRIKPIDAAPYIIIYNNNIHRGCL